MDFSRRRDGTITVDLPHQVRELLGRLLGELRELLLSDDDERLRRLYPTAYPADEAHDREYQQLMHGDLLESQLASLEIVDECLTATTISEGQLAAWMQAINSLRLVIGTQLDVSEDDRPLPDDHPDAPPYALYQLLTHLLGEMIEVADSLLPPPES